MSVMLALIYPEFVSCPSPLKHSLKYKPFNLIIDRSDQKSTNESTTPTEFTGNREAREMIKKTL